ncbi:MAG: 16S rRNA (adenine(1518)-N(6)/adenine(1519)-N(6))-dimethyltransferase RsmA [Chthoniobacterales bacterium]
MLKNELRSRLLELGVHPSKMLGQNFLLDTNLAAAIVAAIEPQAGDHIVEIGPGMGALTRPIVDSPATHITLIERDHRLAEELKTRYADTRVRVICEDAAKIDLREIYGYGPIKVIGNLPYSASTAIIAHFTSAFSPACSLVLMLQREVAERLAAIPGHKDYAALTILLSRRWSVKKLRVVPPDVFWPRPNVESTIVKIVPRPINEVLRCDEKKFRELVRLGFSSRRKQLGSLLKIPVACWTSLAQKLGHPPTARAEDLTVSDWSHLVQQLYRLKATRATELFDVVDEHDHVVEPMERTLVHGKKLRHRAIHIWIFNAKGELFLQKRSLWKDNYPGLWCSSIAGHVDSGEDYFRAAHREMREEIGITTTLKPFHRLEASEETKQEFIECFYGFSEGPFLLDQYELEAGAFFASSVIEQWMALHPENFTPVFKILAKKFLNIPFAC